jgi:predicted DNA binding CopG/RHH family protein
MKAIRLNKSEQAIETALLQGEYLNIKNAEFDAIAQAVAIRRKDAVINIRVNSQDLKVIKEKAKRSGIR